MVRLWDASTSGLFSTLGTATTCATLPSLRDGRQIASVGDGGKVRSWDVESCLSIVDCRAERPNPRCSEGDILAQCSHRSLLQWLQHCSAMEVHDWRI